MSLHQGQIFCFMPKIFEQVQSCQMFFAYLGKKGDSQSCSIWHTDSPGISESKLCLKDVVIYLHQVQLTVYSVHNTRFRATSTFDSMLYLQVWKGQGSRKWKHGQLDGFFVQFESPLLRKLWFISSSNEMGKTLCRSALSLSACLLSHS